MYCRILHVDESSDFKKYFLLRNTLDHTVTFCHFDIKPTKRYYFKVLSSNCKFSSYMFVSTSSAEEKGGTFFEYCVIVYTLCTFVYTEYLCSVISVLLFVNVKNTIIDLFFIMIFLSPSNIKKYDTLFTMGIVFRLDTHVCTTILYVEPSLIIHGVLYKL